MATKNSNRAQLIDTYRALTLTEPHGAEWLMCACLFADLRSKVPGSVKAAKAHLWYRKRFGA